MRFIMPQNQAGAEQLDKLVEEGKVGRMIFCVCWKCGLGPQEKETLYRVGKKDGETVYGCRNHRGLQGQLR